MFIQGYGYLRPFSAIVDLAMTRSEVAATDLRAYCRDMLRIDVCELDDVSLQTFNYVNVRPGVMPLLRSRGAAKVLEPLRATNDVEVFESVFTLEKVTRTVYFVASKAARPTVLANFQEYIHEGFVGTIDLNGRVSMLRSVTYSNFAAVFYGLFCNPEQAIENWAWLSLIDGVFFTLSEPVANAILEWFPNEQ